MKKLFGTGIIATLVVVLAGSWAYAQNGKTNSILFPYINSNPGNLSTIINVINTASDTDVCGIDGPPHMLHYRYMMKLITASNTDYCDESNFCRPTTKNDLVTFDVAGQIESGMAMFNDDTCYDVGFGAPNFDLPTVFGESCAQRGYLLVSQVCGDECIDASDDSSSDLDGEAMLLDIVSGAAWGYRAALSALGGNAFADITGGCNPLPGATTELMAENCGNPPNQNMHKVVLYPPDEFCTRFFVTPLVVSSFSATVPSDNFINADMSTDVKKWQKRTAVCLKTSSEIGVFNRNEAVVSKGQCVQVRCVGAVDLKSLVGSVINAPDFRSEGGWAYLDLVDPSGSDIVKEIDHAAIVTKLQFGSPSSAGGSMINTADTIRTDRIEVGMPIGNPPNPCE